MRKLLVPLLLVIALAVAGAAADTARPAAAASPVVTISATGYKPTAVSITVGESVVFKNSDTVSHSVAFKQATGLHCSAAVALGIAAGQSASCTFSSAGRYSFSDPAHKGKNFRGTITVGVSPTSSLTVTPTAVVYGRKATLAGTLSSQQAGQSVQVLAQQCGASTSTPVTSVTTTTGGKFSYPASPLEQTAYTVKVKNSTSPAVSVGVQPRLQLRRVSRHHFAVRVSAAQSFAGKQATFQRYRRSVKRWVKVKRVLLKTNSTGVAPTVISSAKFRSAIMARLRVRVALGPRQVGACYLAGRSNTIRS
jgi:plastocyanin